MYEVVYQSVSANTRKSGFCGLQPAHTGNMIQSSAWMREEMNEPIMGVKAKNLE